MFYVEVIKTSFEEEQLHKDETFLKLTPFERMAYALKVSQKMRKPRVDYSYEGKKVVVTRLK